jgi:hypothetical protein
MFSEPLQIWISKLANRVSVMYGATVTVTGQHTMTSNPGTSARHTNNHDASSGDASGNHNNDGSRPNAPEPSG